MSSAALHPEAGTLPAPPKARFSLAFLGFLVLSLFAHGATFLLFQVAYPQRVTIPPPAPQVTLLAPGAPEEDALLRWIAAEDPALVAASAAPMPPGAFSVTYQPSYTVLRTPPRTISPPAERPEPPPSPIALPITTAKAHAPESPALTSAAAPMRTSVTLSGELAGRTVTLPSISARFTAPLDSAELLLAVNARGEVRHVMLQRSSGDTEADAEATRALAAASVSPLPDQDGVEWGFATISWGRDAYVISGEAK